MSTTNPPSLSPPTQAWLDSGRFIQSAGRRVFLYERGAGPPLLLLHGFPTSCFDWREVMALLAGRFRCAAFDFPGYGFSDKPADCSYSLFDQADVAEAVTRDLGLAGTEVHVVSHDMGTSVHCELLAREREGRLGFKIRASTFTNGSMLQWRARITPFQEMLASNATLEKAMALCDAGLPGHVAALKTLMKRPEAWSAEDEIVIAELMAHRDGHRRIPALAGYMRERYVHRERWLGALAWAGERIQFAWADGDPIATAELGREHAAANPKARHTEIPGAGHFVIVEAAGTVARLVAEFEPTR